MTTLVGEPAWISGATLARGSVALTVGVVVAARLARAIRAERRSLGTTARPVADAADAAIDVVLVLGPAALRDVDTLAAALPSPSGEPPSREAAIRRALALARWVADEQGRSGTVLVEDGGAGTRTELLRW